MAGLGAKVALVAAATGAAAPPRRYNVFYIVVDDLRPDISPYEVTNAPTLHTPNFQRLADGGTLFEQAHVQQAVCGPSRNSFLSGRRPDATAVWNFIDDFRGSCMGSTRAVCQGTGGNASWSSLPQHFRRHGYRTVGAGKIFQPGAPPDNDELYSWSEPYVYYDIDRCNRTDPRFQQDFCDQPLEGCVDTWLTDRALQNLAAAVAQGSSAPWFVSVGWHKPHPPWPIPRNFTELYPATAPPMPLARFPTLSPTAPLLSYYSARDLGPSEEFAGHNISIEPHRAVPRYLAARLRQAYYGAVSYCDFNLGRVMEELRRLGVENTTCLVVHGDHGFNLGEHVRQR